MHSNAAELLPADKPIQDVVDHYVNAKLTAAKITAAPAADEAILLRRLTLDLAGRIPTVGELQAFVNSKEPDKLAKSVDRLMQSPLYVRYQSYQFDIMLAANSNGRKAGGALRSYFQLAIEQNRPWDAIFKELLLATGEEQGDPKLKITPGEFLRSRVNDADQLTSDVSSIFFGVNISCAKCHDHPLVDDWKQDHFYGMRSFLSRTFDNGGLLGERDYGITKFRTTKGDSKNARMMFLTGAEIQDAAAREQTDAEKKAEKELLEKYKKDKKLLPAPKFSSRAQLVEVALKPGQDAFFSKAIVNRLIRQFFGYGLVEPVDQMHSANAPSHPELLEWLARDTVAHKYDMRRLVRGLLLSKTYARSSHWTSGDRPAQSLFAVGNVRPLTPQQMSTSLRLAIADPDRYPAVEKVEEFNKAMDAISQGGMSEIFEYPEGDFQVSASEALAMSNSDRIVRDLLADGKDKLVGRMQAAADGKQAAELAFHAVLSRAPDAEELQAVTAYLAARSDRKLLACQQVLWSLLAGTEFRFSH